MTGTWVCALAKAALANRTLAACAAGVPSWRNASSHLLHSDSSQWLRPLRAIADFSACRGVQLPLAGGR